MLLEILLNFSEDELRSFLPKESIAFLSDFIPSNESEEGLTKEKLSKIIYITKKVDFIFNDNLRSLLIERMKPDFFINFFHEFSLTVDDLEPRHYEAAISWSCENLQAFSSKLGMADVYESEEKNEDNEWISVVDPNYALYAYQQEISKSVFQSFSLGKRRVLVHLPTGSGKTRTAMNIACEHMRSSSSNVVLWLADREELCQQAFDEFEKSWLSLGNRSTSIYGFYSDSKESLSGIDSGFVVAGLHKFLSLRKSDSRQLQILYDELREKVTLVIFDEAHKAVAPKFSEVVSDFIDCEGFHADLIGLTATPGRSYSPEGLSEQDEKLSDFFGSNKVSMDIPGYISPIDYLVENEYLAKAKFQSLNYDHSGILAYELSDAGGDETMKTLSNNTDRNRKIIDTIIKECELGSQIIVFSCTVSHAVNLAVALASNGIRAASIDSNNDTTESRREKIKQYKELELQVLVNFNILTAGFDAPKTNVAIIAKPMNSLVQYLQMAGRAMRGYKSGGNKECTIYTVMDDIPEFQSVNLAFEYWDEMWVNNGSSCK